MNRRKFKLRGKASNKSISPKMIKVINNIKKDLQRNENIEFGRRARTVSFQFASQWLADRIDRGKL